MAGKRYGQTRSLANSPKLHELQLNLFPDLALNGPNNYVNAPNPLYSSSAVISNPTRSASNKIRRVQGSVNKNQNTFLLSKKNEDKNN